MAKNNKTFAQRAKELIKQYKRADFDPVEKQELESALEALAEEQEVYKKINGIDQGENEEYGDYEENNEYQNGGEFLVDPAGVTGEVPIPGISYSGSFNVPEPSYTSTSVDRNAVVPQDTGFSPYSTSYLPTIAAGATSLLGNIALSRRQRDPEQVSLQRYHSPTISREFERQELRREASKARSRAKHGIKGAARTRGEYLGAVGATEADISGKLGETLSRSRGEEAITNARIRAEANRVNAEIANREALINQQLKDQARQREEAYLSSALSTVPQVSRDISAQMMQDRLISSLGEDYGWYMYQDPNRRFSRKRPVIGYRSPEGVRLAQGFNY